MEKASRALLPGVLVAMSLACALRLARLDSVPVSLYCDEAFSGYEAYCLLHTGHDSRGVLLPLFFDIFGKGWGEPLYVYLTVPAVAVLGLTPFATRLVAALAGTLAVPLTGLMVAALLRGRGDPRASSRAGIAASFLMAISPWSFHLSRVAFQASLLPLMLAAGFWLAARGLAQDRRASLVAGAALLGLSLYTYTIARLAMPLLLAGFVWTHRQRLFGVWRPAVAAGLTLAGLAFPIAFFSLTSQGRQRLSDVSIVTRPEIAAAGPARIAAAVGSNYLSYYSLPFLLTEGDTNLRHSIRGHGMLHPHEVALLALGIVVCAASRSGGGLFLLWWLLVYAVPASLTVDPRHAVRAICGLPGLYAIEGVGAALLWGAAVDPRGSRVRRSVSHALVIALAAASIVPVLGYFEDYFTQYPVYSGAAWQYGLKEVYDYVESVNGTHDSVYITRYEDFPFIQLLFYRAFPPHEYQAHRLSGTRYLFDQDRWVRGPGRLSPIFVWKPEEVPDAGAQVHHVIKYPDGSDAFVIAW